MRYYVSWKTTGYYRKDSLKLAARCHVCYVWTLVHHAYERSCLWQLSCKMKSFWWFCIVKRKVSSCLRAFNLHCSMASIQNVEFENAIKLGVSRPSRATRCRHQSSFCSTAKIFYSAPQCSHCKRCTSYGHSVRLSVRLSHAGIVSKRLHVARCSLYCQIAKCGRPLPPEILAQSDPPSPESSEVWHVLPCSASTVRDRKRSSITLNKKSTRSFQRAIN